MNRKNPRGGYIAIMSSIVLSLVLMVVAISLGSSSLFTRLNVADFGNKQLSYFIARSCLNEALLKLADSSSYTGNETLMISSRACTLSAITTSAPNKIIQAKAIINGATTNLKLTVNSTSLSTVSLEELPTL